MSTRGKYFAEIKVMGMVRLTNWKKGRIKLEDWIDVKEVKAMEEFWTEEWIWE